MNLVLFALTGIGNAVLSTLVEIGRKPVLLVTRQENGAYPYYEETQITELARKFGVRVLIGEDGEAEAVRICPDIIFVATYHRLLSNELIQCARHAFNLHPSLLPAYAGKNPFYAVLVSGELETGVTIHCLTEKLDEGEVMFREKIEIRENETQGSLRLALANLAGDVTKSFFMMLDTAPSKVSPLDYRPKNGYFRSPRQQDRVVNLTDKAELICRQIRALSPWPCGILEEIGCSIRAVSAIDYEIKSSAVPGTLLFVGKTIAKARVADAEITFFIE